MAIASEERGCGQFSFDIARARKEVCVEELTNRDSVECRGIERTLYGRDKLPYDDANDHSKQDERSQ